MSAHAGEVHGAKDNERHASGRLRVVSGPCPVSRQVPQKTGGVTFSPTLRSLPSNSLPAGIR